MSTHILGVGDHRAANTPGEILKTFALGSCVALIVHDPKTGVVGMAHIALPDSKINPERSRERPAYFADTGLPALTRSLSLKGLPALTKKTIVKMVGGATVVAGMTNAFNVGGRNIVALRRLLWDLRLAPAAEDVGGSISRTVWVEAGTGRVTVTSPGRGEWYL